MLTEQERYFRSGELPHDYRLPAHERLARKGIVFENHRISSCVCAPSRSVLYTGRHIEHTKMFDNTNLPWIGSMSTDLTTPGHLLREAGYYTACCRAASTADGLRPTPRRTSEQHGRPLPPP